MEILLLVTAQSGEAASVLPALDLLPHSIRTAPRDVRALLSAPAPDAVLVDARSELVEARATCRMLHTTGLALKNNGVADMALRYLKDVTPIVVDISKAIPAVVVKDLQDQEATVDTSAAQEAVRRTQEAWSGDNTM